MSEAARLFLGHRSLDAGSGLLLAVPIPEENAADGKEIEDAIQVRNLPRTQIFASIIIDSLIYILSKVQLYKEYTILTKRLFTKYKSIKGRLLGFCLFVGLRMN